uniref:Uncharacterized protein n=1 Tax=Anguilla anguilla TaxID=7936 RepID=A0A0E9S452_ANGAN
MLVLTKDDALNSSVVNCLLSCYFGLFISSTQRIPQFTHNP